jgi:6-phosphogluconolactonase
LARFVYVANIVNQFLSGTVSAYRISPDGALRQVAGSPFPAGNDPDSVAVDLLGRIVYVANSGGTVSAYRVGENGTLKPVAVPRRELSPFRGGGPLGAVCLRGKP